MTEADKYNRGNRLYVVFLQRKEGAPHMYEGEVWASNETLALYYAKEQFARRGRCSSIWLVPHENISESNEKWAEAYRRDGNKRWRHASFFAAGRDSTPDLASRLIKELEGQS